MQVRSKPQKKRNIEIDHKKSFSIPNTGKPGNAGIDNYKLQKRTVG